MLSVVPRPARSLAEGLQELADCARRPVVALTLFVDAGDPARFAGLREVLLAEVEEFFDGDPPPTSVVAQAPDVAGPLAMEATLAPPGASVVARRRSGGLRYAVVAGRGFREVHGRGIGSAPGLAGTPARCRDAFARMEAVLRGEGLGFGHVVRQWAYVEGVLDVHADLRAECQGYQAFNDVRAQAYARTEFPAGYPAATGIGQAAGGVVLEFVALDAPGATVVPLSNPRQTDAHRYSAGLLVGESIATQTAPCTPRFERGKRVIRGGEEILLVSGTAAIVGERSVDAGDVAAQTATTIENIHAIVGARGLSQLRAYVKRPGDVAVVRRLCEEAFGRIPALYVRADVCRDELLVEIEGAVVTEGGPACE